MTHSLVNSTVAVDRPVADKPQDEGEPPSQSDSSGKDHAPEGYGRHSLAHGLSAPPSGAMPPAASPSLFCKDSTRRRRASPPSRRRSIAAFASAGSSSPRAPASSGRRKSRPRPLPSSKSTRSGRAAAPSLLRAFSAAGCSNRARRCRRWKTRFMTWVCSIARRLAGRRPTPRAAPSRSEPRCAAPRRAAHGTRDAGFRWRRSAAGAR